MGKFIRVSHFSLTLVFLVTTFAKDGNADHTDITWTSPVGGDKYGPGDTIIGKWDSVKSIISPSFRLCMSDSSSSMPNSTNNSDDGCGSTVWPTVQQSAKSYSISLAVPNVTSEEGFFLRMEDDFGKIMLSPVFTLSPTIVSDSQTIDSDPDIGPSDTSSNTSEAPDSPSSGSVNPQPPLADASAAPDNVPATPTATSGANAHSVNPLFTLSRTPPPVAAFAVPLSLVGAILLVAGGLSLRHHRKLEDERARDAEKLDLSRRSSMSTFTSSSTRHSEVKHALDVLAMNDARYGPAFPVDIRREQRRSTRQPMYPASPRYATPMNAVSASAFHPATQITTPEDDDINAAATHSVISNYLVPSPTPPSSFLSAPQQLHVRTEASLPRSNAYDKPLPHSPRSGPGCAEGRDIYDAVAQAVGRRIA